MSSIKKYKWNDSVQLTKNINVRELRCKDGSKTLIDLDHVQKVQNFMDINGYDKVVFSSGYRSKAYNKKIGGSSKSIHCDGKATDECFYKNGKIVPSKEVCCKAQDYGFPGIAYIDKNYVHLDNRPSGKYRGDETKGFGNNVPNGDFYAYFGIAKSGTSAKTKYTGTFPTIPSRGYFKNGDKGTQVKNLQKFLNWALNLKLAIDGIVGIKTLNAVAKFQTKVGVKADKLFGKNTLIKAKTFSK